MPFITSPSLRASTGILTNVPFISRSAALLERWREAEFHMHRLAFAEMVGGARVRIPAMPITNSNLMAIRIPIDADHHRSEATLGCTYHR
jgi:hypothetical protein